MAQKVHVLLVCDLHEEETEGAETVGFGLDGSSYEIDVCDEHAAGLRDAFAGYVGAARRAGRSTGGSANGSARRAARPAARGAGDKDRVSLIREWARENGHQVSERGRLSGAVTQAYDAAH